ncbi:MAG: 3-phosphoshikimate 1-carboxyvinyltransferase [Ruminococcus sp.]|nr:3-phosphoshikimate 1-carboxyvinyltransferase [Ruminococcus sp.]
MDKLLVPKKLRGEVTAPPSKSEAHRLLIAAALAKGRSVISGLAMSQDIAATAGALEAFGARIVFEGDTAVVDGVTDPPEAASVDCGESGSTLRFLIPVAAALGIRATFIGRGRLPRRPITPYLEELPKHGIGFMYNGSMPFVVSGRLAAGDYRMPGDVSSQFITGLLFALSLLRGDSRVMLTSHLESRPYVDITADVLSRFGGSVEEIPEGYLVRCRRLSPCNARVEGDWSQAAFFEVANAIGNSITINGLNVNSSQGDKKIIEICREMVYNNGVGLKAFSLDCSDIPDLVPVLAVLGCFCEGRTVLENVARLRIKESDRLAAISNCIERTGGRARAFEDRLEIEGVGRLSGGEVDSFGDHRIAMAMAVASTRSEGPILIRGAECVAKSYPDFWEVFDRLGGGSEEA